MCTAWRRGNTARLDPAKRDRHVAAAIAGIEEKFGHGSIQRLGATTTLGVQVIPLGLAELDRIVGVGGLPRGRIVEVLGPESSGVSTLLLHAVAAAQRRGGIAALIDVDRGFDPEYARKIGIDLSSLFIAQPDDGAMPSRLSMPWCGARPSTWSGSTQCRHLNHPSRQTPMPAPRVGHASVDCSVRRCADWPLAWIARGPYRCLAIAWRQLRTTM
jgi:hypothetical protein